jgi:hypothetical protein
VILKNECLYLEIHDLSRQVQHLLREIERNRNGGSPSSNKFKDLGPDPSSATPSGQVISDHLVIFSNIVELQGQNQQLR